MEKRKPVKAKAPVNASKMDTTGLDYSSTSAAGKVVRILWMPRWTTLSVFQENGRSNSTVPIAARPEQGDLKAMAVEYVAKRSMRKARLSFSPLGFQSSQPDFGLSG